MKNLNTERSNLNNVFCVHAKNTEEYNHVLYESL